MNQNFYDSNSSGFDQTQPPQFFVIHPPPQETSIKILHDQENKIDFVQTFLRKFNRYSFFETPKVLLLAWDKVFKIKDALGNKQYKLEDIQELFRELFNDVQNNHEELAEDEHLDTIPEKESDEFIKSSVENLVPIPSESEDFSNIKNLDSTSKNDRFDTKYYLPESLLNRDESIPSGIDCDDSNSKGDNLFLERLLHDDPIPLPDTLDFSNVIRVFLPFFTYPVTSSILLSSGSEDTIFDPGISNYHFSSLEPGLSHRCGTFKKFNTHRSHLNESPMEMLFSTCSPIDQ
nr:hypothetical protein [Tanacetum cinerariifolium]GEY46108.1 hypothetical protein [Tanacetum cinerariifolium]